jgi:hypothetical protein
MSLERKKYGWGKWADFGEKSRDNIFVLTIFISFNQISVF